MISRTLFAFLLYLTCACSLGFAAEHGMWVLERPDINFKIALCGLTVTLLVGVALVGTWGVLGAVIAQLCGVSLVSVTQCAVFARLTSREASPGHSLQAMELAK